jgi:MFS family permease
LSDDRLTPPHDPDNSRDALNRVSSPEVSFPQSTVDDGLVPAIDAQSNGSNGDWRNPALSNVDADEADADADRGFVPVLRNRNFLALWSGQVFSQMADKVYLVLVIALVASQFQAAGQTISGWVSAIMIAFTIPAVLFGSVAGVFVDRWSKKGVLVATNLLRGALVLAMPPLLWISKDWGLVAGLPVGFYILLGLTFLVSTLTQFFAPAEQSVMPLIVERHRLLSANSLYTMTMMASVIVGFAVGEPLLGFADTVARSLGGGLDIGKEIAVGGLLCDRGVAFAVSSHW